MDVTLKQVFWSEWTAWQCAVLGAWATIWAIVDIQPFGSWRTLAFIVAVSLLVTLDERASKSSPWRALKASRGRESA